MRSKLHCQKPQYCMNIVVGTPAQTPHRQYYWFHVTWFGGDKLSTHSGPTIVSMWFNAYSSRTRLVFMAFFKPSEND
eukprot:1732007-Amphidinium_carterae.1